jgi:hypothetical protein
MIAKARSDPGASDRRQSASGVIVNAPSSRSAKTPTAASARSTRYSASASASRRSASSPGDLGPSAAMTSATPRRAATYTAWVTQAPVIRPIIAAAGGCVIP